MKKLIFQKPELIKINTNLAYGNIGGITVGAGWTAASDKTTVFKDSQSLLLTATAANDNSECILASPTLVTNEDYWQKLWVFPSAIHDDSKLYLDIDGAATPILSREVGKSLGDNGEFARDFNLDATYYAQAANNTIHDMTTEDIGVWAWVKVGSTLSSVSTIASKTTGLNSLGYILYLHSANGSPYFYIHDGVDFFYMIGAQDLRDGLPHFVAAIIDKSNVNNCNMYVDGVALSLATAGNLALVGSLTNASIFRVGDAAGGGRLFDGFIRDAGICYPADIMAAGEMGEAGAIAAMYANPGDLTQYPNFEDRWACDDNAASTVVVGAVNNLAASANTNTFAEEHWKMYEVCWEADRAAITGKLRITGAGAGANSCTAYVDDAQLMVNMIDSPGMEGGADPPAGWTQEGSATVISDTSPHSGTNCLKATAGAVNVGASQNVTLVSGKYYTVTGWAKVTAADTAQITMDTGDTSTVSIGTTTNTIWVQIQATFLSTGTSGVIYLRGVANGDVVWFDDISILLCDEADASTDSKAAGNWPKTNPIYIG